MQHQNPIGSLFSLKIMAVSEEGHRILKNYQPKGRRVANIKIENYLIRVNLAEVSTGYMEVSGFDTIMNQEADEKATIYVDSSISEVKERQVQLVMRKACDSGKIRQIVAKHMIVDEIPVVKLDLEENSDRFYVYTRGQVDLVTDRIQDAIAVANEDLGVVVDRNQNYVWMRARNLNQTALTGLNPNEGDEGADSIAMALSILLHRNDVDVTVHTLLESGQTPRAIMNNYLKNSTVLDLSGCAVDEVLFYVSNGNPVFALTDSDRGELVVGYTTNSVYLYDPKNKKLETVPLEKAEELFENCGNVFLSYLN